MPYLWVETIDSDFFFCVLSGRCSYWYVANQWLLYHLQLYITSNKKKEKSSLIVLLHLLRVCNRIWLSFDHLVLSISSVVFWSYVNSLWSVHGWSVKCCLVLSLLLLVWKLSKSMNNQVYYSSHLKFIVNSSHVLQQFRALVLSEYLF